MEIERIAYISEKNEEATDTLFLRILRQNPAVVFHLGDLVSSGADNSSWGKIDVFLGNLKQQQIPFYPVMGNHDYMFNAKKGKANFEKRFPAQSENIYIEIVDSIAVVLFNSNFSKLNSSENSLLRAAYTQKMDSLQEDNAVRFIVLGTHHPAFTNNTVVKPSKEILADFVPKYITTPKAVLFLSGHAHHLEIFQHKGKYLCNIGGGGGIFQPLKEVEKQEKREVLLDIPRYRFFYLTLERKGDILTVKEFGMDPDSFSTENQVEIFSLSRN